MRNALQNRTSMEQRQRYVSDVFHMLGQPLTELQMSLEIALAKELDPVGYRASIGQALQATRRVLQTAKFVRQLAEAEDPGHSEFVDFTEVLRETIEDFEPVAECNHIEIGHAVQDGLNIFADPGRIKRALFLLMDYALHSAIPGARIHVMARACGRMIVAEIGCYAQEMPWEQTNGFTIPTANESMGHTLQLAERMMVAAQGSLCESRDAAGAKIIARVPLAQPYRQREAKTLAS